MVAPRFAWLLIGSALAVGGCIVPSTPASPSTGAWRLSGTIGSTAGVPIAGAVVTVQEGANRDTQVTSDASGHFVFAQLEGGRFKVFIQAPGFVSLTPVIDLFTDIDVTFALHRPDEVR
jgi:hypothetical protein